MSKAPGSSQASAASKTPVTGQAGANNNDPKKRPPKGHRQKGAGTVVVSKGEVKRDGLEIKEWQQTPKQLLMNYCKAEKRPLPRYVSASGAPSGKFLARVILPDPKDQHDKDMMFVPKETHFDSMVEAEHAVALLALHKVDGARSHELKLPEPYRTAWLKLVGRSGPASAQASTAPAADPFTCEECGKGFSKAHGLETHKKTAHPKPKRPVEGGVDSEEGTVPSPAPTPPVISQSPVALETPAIIEKPRDPSNTPQGAVEEEKQKVETKESGLLQLQARSEFATEKERNEFFERIRIQKERKQRQRKLEENEDEDYVFMSEENRIEVEAIVRDAAQTLRHSSHHIPLEVLEGGFSEEAKIVIDTLVKKMGFARSDARSAVHNGGASLDQALEWLLVHLDEDRLPAGFDPRGMQLEVSAPKNNPSAVRGSKKIAFPSPSSSNTEIVQWFRTELLLDFSAVSGTGDKDEVQQWQQEWEALESILGEDARLVQSDADSVFKYVLKLSDFPENGKVSHLEIYFDSSSYPTRSSPLVLFRGPASDDVLINWALKCTLKTREFQGEPCAFALWDWMRLANLNDVENESVSLSTTNETASTSTATNLATRSKTSSSHHHHHKEHVKVKGLSDFEKQKQSEDLQRRLVQRRKDEETRQRKPLPAHRFRNEIVQAVNVNRVVIIKGETGCGKTTQVPQFILDSETEVGRGGRASIIVTQPRRLAAVSVAIRVAEERGEEVGDVVGYRVQLESKAHPLKTRLEFVTTGLLLRRMQAAPDLQSVSHVIVDEVHERSLDSDFLLALLRQALKDNPALKVVLMSATMDAARFSSYFGGAPVLEIPGFTFPVKDLYLEEALEMSECRPWAERGARDKTVTATDRLESMLDFQFIAACVRQCHRDLESDGSILVFLSGVAEISSTIRACEALSDGDLHLLPLHGALTGPDQRRVFERPPKGKRKVIVSTNVAETSVTIDDVVCVIDSGRMKEVRFDPASKMSSLVDTWVSLASARQRRGRAGRVREGICLKLWSKTRQLVPDQLAEVHRVPLEQCVLQVASMELSMNLVSFFESLVDPPVKSSVHSAIDSLVAIGAMTEASTELPQMYKLTPLGQHLARLPMDARLGKMLIVSSLLGVAESAATIAAALSRRSPFLTPSQERREEAKQARKALASTGIAQASQSDHLILVTAFEGWRACSSEKERRKFCSENLLADEAMREISKLRTQYLDSIEHAGFNAIDEISTADAHKLVDMDARKRRLVKASLCAGLFPNVVKIRRPSKRYVETLGGALEAQANAKELSFEFFNGKETKRVFLHPSSINFENNSFNSSWLVFSELVQTTKPFVRDCTAVAPYGLLLFGGELSVKHEDGVILSGKFMRFKMSPRVAVLVKELKKLLDVYLADKLAKPDEDLDDTRALEACKRLIVGNGFF